MGLFLSSKFILDHYELKKPITFPKCAGYMTLKTVTELFIGNTLLYYSNLSINRALRENESGDAL